MRSKPALLIGAAAIVVVLDQLTKFWIRGAEAWQYRELVEGWLAFHYIKNPGMALGIDLLDTRVVGVLSIVATVLIGGYVIKHLNISGRAYVLLMGLILGGAIGNLIDRIFMGKAHGYGGWLEGHVTDFIHFSLRIGDFPVFPYIFNVADMAISVSVVILLVFSKRLMPAPPAPAN
jgi:signal peptidase II